MKSNVFSFSCKFYLDQSLKLHSHVNDCVKSCDRQKLNDGLEFCKNIM